mgnify:CR=1 FL=1
MSVFITFVAALLIFGAVIAIHEFGHFAVAKLCGVQVNEFSIGMGPTLIKTYRKGTQYTLRLLPVGGFVALEGEESPESEQAEGGSGDDDGPDIPPEVLAQRTGKPLNEAAVWQRMLVMAAGAVMNFVLGFVVLLLLISLRSEPITSKVIYAVEDNALCGQTGLQAGDEIVAVNGRHCFVANDMLYELMRTESYRADFTVRRDGKLVELPDVQFDTWQDEQGQTHMTLGFTVYGLKKTPQNVLKESANSVIYYGRIIYTSLADLLRGRESINDLSGPVGIVTAIGQAASYGWEDVAELLALITINLGVFNLLNFIDGTPGGAGISHMIFAIIAALVSAVLAFVIEFITYRPNEEMLDILVRDGRLPGSLQNIFVEDVTESYTRVDDLSLEIPKRQTGNKTVYLSVFDNQEWIPVYWGKRSDRRRVRFERMGRDIVYLPVVYGDSERPIPVDDPFFVHPDGRVERLRADTSRLRNIRISRKYPIYELVYKQAVKLRGGKIEAADNPQFRNAETVLRFPEERVVMAGTDSVQSRKPYRYWRFCSSHEGRCDMAELIFYTGDERLQGKLVTCGKEVNPKAKVQIAPAIHDDDALTFFCAQGNDYWVGFDFGKPVDISKILWFRRGDGNDIYPDYEYTLYYWGDRCWQAIGQQKAGSQTWLDFPNVPQNALLLLVCDTKGTQSRPFAYRNGEIEWY